MEESKPPVQNSAGGEWFRSSHGFSINNSLLINYHPIGTPSRMQVTAPEAPEGLYLLPTNSMPDPSPSNLGPSGYDSLYSRDSPSNLGPSGSHPGFHSFPIIQMQSSPSIDTPSNSHVSSSYSSPPLDFHSHPFSTPASLSGPFPVSSPPPPIDPQIPSTSSQSALSPVQDSLSWSEKELYSQLLLSKKEGFPLWNPKPDENLACEYRKRGTSIGDVGYLNGNGSFIYLFNVCALADDPVNARGVPDGFRKLDIDPGNVTGSEEYYKPAEYVASNPSSLVPDKILCGPTQQQIQGVPAKFGAGLSFASPKGSTGALLILPEGGNKVDHTDVEKFRKYAKSHAHSWFSYARARCLHSLYLITGCNKARAWGAACYNGAYGEVCLEFVPDADALGDNNDAGPEYWFSKKRFAAVQSGADSKSKNQCVFLRGLKVTLRKRSLDRKTTVKVSVIPGAGLDVDKELRSKGKGTSTSWGKSLFSRTSSDSTQGLEDASSSPSSPQRGSPGSKSTEEDESTDSDDSFYFWAEPYHPSDILNRWILNEYPDVDIAFTHDNDWIWAICEGEAMPDDTELVFRLSSYISIEREGGSNGGIRCGSFKTPHDAHADSQDSTAPAYHLPSNQQSSGTPQSNNYLHLVDYYINYAVNQQVNYIQPSESYHSTSYNNNIAATWSRLLPASSYGTTYAGSSSGVAYSSDVHPTRNSPYPPTSYSSAIPSYSSTNFQEPWGSSHVDTQINSVSYASSSSYATLNYLPTEPYRSTTNPFASAHLPALGSTELMLSPYSNGSVPLSHSPSGPEDEESRSQVDGSSEDSISRTGQYSHREQVQLFRDALSLPYSSNAGPFIPQNMYKPHTNSDRLRHVEEIDLDEPIYFWMENPSECGISLSDALHSRVRRLLDRDKTVFEGRGPSVSIRLEWPGYRPWSRQIPTKDFRTPPGPITRAKLAKNVAKCVLRFISERQNHSLEDEYNSRWRVSSGKSSIKLEDLILVSFHHVSMGSWQPHLRLARPLAV